MSEQVKAPELDACLGWLNTDRPLHIHQELRGQVVVLDFWTYCCVNCMHILPDLAYLEHKYENDPVAFIGVHSAKFANEANRQTIRAATLRYHIHHPVVIDDQMDEFQVFLGYGDGTFQPPLRFPTLGDPEFVVSVDINGDGRLDLITANDNSDSIAVIFGVERPRRSRKSMP